LKKMASAVVFVRLLAVVVVPVPVATAGELASLMLDVGNPLTSMAQPSVAWELVAVADSVTAPPATFGADAIDV
jgi:hypothetical protein